MKRNLQGFYFWLCLIFTWIAIGATIIYNFRIRFFGHAIPYTSYLALLLCVFLPLVFLVYPANKKKATDKIPWYDLFFAVLSFIGPAFLVIFALEIPKTLWVINPPIWLLILGVITCGLIVEGVRRVIGPLMAVIISLFSLYPLFASYMPGIFHAKSYPLGRIITYYFLTTDGMFGVPFHAFGVLIIGFILFGMALNATGASRFILNLATSILGKLTGGPALIAVISSAFKASLSGDSISHAATTGTVTIPAMKKIGIPAEIAAAIEAIASNAGLLTPPVMGSIAFIMAGVLGIPYAHVAIAASFPMLIYYIGVFANTLFYAYKMKLPAWSDEIPSLKKVFAEVGFTFLCCPAYFSALLYKGRVVGTLLYRIILVLCRLY